MLIDNSLPEYADVPASLNGEVLLERTYFDDGGLSGFLTATIETCREMKTKPAAERTAAGWDRYQHILDAISL